MKLMQNTDKEVCAKKASVIMGHIVNTGTSPGIMEWHNYLYAAESFLRSR